MSFIKNLFAKTPERKPEQKAPVKAVYDGTDLVELFPDELMKIAKVRIDWRYTLEEAKEMERETVYKYRFLALPAEIVFVGEDAFLECNGVRVGRFKDPEKVKNVTLTSAWIGGGPFRIVQDDGFSELFAPYYARLSFERRL